jgi:serine/threonine protein kinase
MITPPVPGKIQDDSWPRVTSRAAKQDEATSADPSRADLPEIPGYDVLEKLGRGGMGVVYKAWQPSLKRLVALKLLASAGRPEPEQLVRFRTEAEAVACLEHPNIVRIYEVGEKDGQPYLALEYVDGGSLAQRLDGTPLPPRAAAAVIETLARAVEAAHQRGIVHRDLKPGNVLVAGVKNQESGVRNRAGRTEPRFPLLCFPTAVTLLPLLSRSPISAWQNDSVSRGKKAI